MANFKSKLPLAFSQNGIPILFLLIAISIQLAVAMPGKDTKPSDSISLTSSETDWSRDLDNVECRIRWRGVEKVLPVLFF